MSAITDSNLNDLPVVDSHLHIWDPARLHYPWLDEFEQLNKPFLPKDYRSACREIRIDKMVFLQCECIPEEFAEEVKWITSLAEEDNRIQGIVAGAALEKGDAIRPYLEELKENKLVKGVRRIIESEEDPEFCLGSDFVKGLALLEKYDFSFDICANSKQLKQVTELVKQFPNVRFVLDHIGNPDIKNQLWEPWKGQLKALAELPNLWCKISGLVTQADLENWTREDLKPYIDYVIECFSFDRVMYGGDWPVATLAAGYPDWIGALNWATQTASKANRERLFYHNAIAFYRL